MADHNDLGRQGEAIAEKFLKKKRLFGLSLQLAIKPT